MSDLILSNVDEKLVDELNARARASRATLADTAQMLLRSALNREPEEGYGPVEIVDIVNRSHPSDSTYLIRRDRDGVSENDLGPAEALRTVQGVRALSLQPVLPDSTPSIRMDRDA